MAGQTTLPAPLCGPSGPRVHATTKEGEGERAGVGGGGGIDLWRVCAGSSAYFFRCDVFTVQRFLALCLGVVMGRFVPLPGTSFFWRRTSTPEEEVEEEEDEGEQGLLPSSKLRNSAGRIMIRGRPRFQRACIFLRLLLPIGAAKRGFREGCTLVVDRLCHFQSDLGLHHHGGFLGSPPPLFCSSSWLTTTHSVESTVFGATAG